MRSVDPPAVERLALDTADGERLAALHLPHGSEIGVVLAHGFTGSIAKPTVLAVAAALARHAGVLAFDFRGHGGSTGVSTLGDREVLDVDAAVQRMRDLGYRKVVTCGWSMGGATVLRHAALHGGVDAVVCVSAASRWYYRGTRPMRLLHLVVERRLGRLVARRWLRTRIDPTGRWEVVPESPVEVAPRISPTPLLLVHGDRDAYFPVEHAQALFAAARDPKELWLVEGMGHAENGASPELLDRIGRHLPRLLARASAA